MTLVVALACSDGVVIASDSQVSYGQAPLKRTTGSKLFPLGTAIVMGAAGSVGAIQEIAENLGSGLDARSDATVRSIKNLARKVIHGVTREHLHRFRRLGHEHVEDPPAGEVVLVSAAGGPTICHIQPDGYCEMEHKYCAIGSSMLYAELLLKDYYREGMSVEDGKVVAFWTIRNASEVDTFVGGPIQMRVLTADSVREVPEPELRALGDDYQFRKSLMRDLFHNWGAVSPDVLQALATVKEKARPPPPREGGKAAADVRKKKDGPPREA